MSNITEPRSGLTAKRRKPVSAHEREQGPILKFNALVLPKNVVLRRLRNSPNGRNSRTEDMDGQRQLDVLSLHSDLQQRQSARRSGGS